MNLVVVTDRSGQVIAAALPTSPSRSKVTAGLSPLPGQKLHHVEVPRTMAELAPEEQLRAALEHRIPKGSRRLEQVTKSSPKKSRKGA